MAGWKRSLRFLFATTGMLGIAQAALAADLFVDLRSDFAPGSEVNGIVTAVRTLDGSGVPNASLPVVPTSDLLGGVRAFGFIDFPFTNQTLQITVTLMGPTGIMGVGSVTFFNTNQSKVVTLEVTRDGGRLASETSYWTEWISEEVPFGTRCAPGFAVDGLQCSGNFCDNVKLRCKRIPTATNAFFTDTVSGTPGIGTCAPDGFMDGMGCDAGFCDDITLYCDDTESPPSLDCYQSPTITDDAPSGGDPRRSFRDDSSDGDHWVTSLRCEGPACDDKILSLCSLPLGSVATNVIDSRCLASDPAGGGIIVTPCPTEGAIQNGDPDRFFSITPEGIVSQDLGDQCLTIDPEDPDSVVLGPCEEAVRFSLDAWSRLPLLDEPSLCLGYPLGQPQDAPVSIEPCVGAPTWFPSSRPPEILKPPPALFFSEVVETLGEGKAVEIYNNSSQAVDLSDYQVHVHLGEGGELDAVIPLTGMLGAGKTFVVVRDDPLTPAALLAVADLLADGLAFDGNDPIELFSVTEGRSVDVFGQRFVELPSFSDETADARDHTLRRKSTVCLGDVVGTDPFPPSEQWVQLVEGQFAGLGEHHVNCFAADAVPLAPGTAAVLAIALAGAGLTALRRSARRADLP